MSTISNFTDIRLGEYPHCVDVRNLGRYHSNDGVMAETYLNDTNFAQLRKLTSGVSSIALFCFKWEEQLEYLPECWKDSVVLWDSRNEQNPLT